MTKKFYIIDGYSFVFRAYHSMPPLTSPDGTPVGAVYGFTNMLIRLLKEIRKNDTQEKVCGFVAFDSGSKNFRHDLFDQYKANRPEAAEDLVVQFDIIRKAANVLGFKAFDIVGFEADDLIATVAKKAEKSGFKVSILSSDKDLMQLINENISMFDPIRKKIYDEAAVEAKLNVKPGQVGDYLALVGDSSDNIPGVPGIGAKTAAELLHKFNDLDGIYANLEEITQKRRYDSLKNNRDLAKLSRKLVALNENVEIKYHIDELIVEPHEDSQEFAEFAIKYGFKSMIPAGMDVENGATSKIERPEVAFSINQLKNEQDFHEIIKFAQRNFNLYFAFLEDEKNPGDYVLWLASQNGHMSYVIINDDSNGDQFFTESNFSMRDIIKILKPIFQNDAIVKICHNVKEIFKLVGEFSNFQDLMIMSYVGHNGLHGHDFTEIISALFAHQELEKFNDFLGSGKKRLKINNLDTESLESHLKQFGKNFIDAQENLIKIINDQKLWQIYKKIDQPMVSLLFEMENQGVKVDPIILNSLSTEFSEFLTKYEKEIHHLAGKEFNIASPKQLSEILFEHLAIPYPGKKSGSKSTNVEILEDLSHQGYEIANLLLKWRQISKLKSTYVDALFKQINSETQRIHSHFGQCSTSTGRLSSHDPNLQNIPIRSSEGIKIREAFIVEKGNKLISADYSQIELRILAHIAEIEPLIKAFEHGEDIHAATASGIFSVPIEQVDANLRRRAKAINFGIIYGISAYGLAKQLGISNSEAKEYIEKYFTKYPGIEKYMDDIKKYAEKHGYVKTLFGRRCHFTNINSKNFMQRNLAQRAAINAPIQGTAADIIKKAMINITKRFNELNLQSKIILQIHDELLIESPNSETENVMKIVKTEMENAVSLKTFLKVDIAMGDNWAEIH